MTYELASAYITVLPSFQTFNKSLSGLDKDFEKAGKAGGEKMADGAQKGMKANAKKIVAPLAGAMAGLAVGDFLKDSIEGARESQKIGRLTEQVIKSTGGAAKISAQQVGDLATQISNKTAMDDEMIQTGANMLLTFKNIRNEAGKNNDVFNQATAAAVDLSAAGFGSVESASVMLGKALNDPAKGVTALTRVGVTFTDQQKEQIKTLTESGDVLGAQKVILAEVEGQVGGAAASQATAVDQLKVTYGNLQEQIGGVLLPVVEGLAAGLVDKVLPAVSGFITGMEDGTGWGGKFSDGLSIVKDVFMTTFDYVKQNVVPALKDFGTWIKDNSEALKTAGLYVGALSAGIVAYKAYVIASNAVTKAWTAITKAQTIAQKALNWAMRMNPIGLVIGAVTGLIVILAVAYKRHEGFRNLVDNVWKKIKEAAKGFTDWFSNKAWPAIKNVFTKVRDGVSSIKDAFTRAKDGITSTWKNIINAVSRPINVVIDKVNSFLTNLKNGLNKIPGVDLTGNWTIRKIILDTADATVSGGRAGAATALASGGKVPGWSPHDRADNIPAWLTAGEYVLPVKATERLRSMIGDGGLEALRRGSLPGFASGGLVGTAGWLKGLLGRLTKPFGDSWPGQVAKGVARNLNPKNILDKIMASLSRVVGGQRVNYGGSYGWAPTGMNWQNIWSRIQAAAPEAVMTSNYRPGAITASGVPSLHGQGRAVDIVSGDMAATFRKIQNLLPWSQLFYTPMGGAQIGYRDSIVARTHNDHIHAAFNQGGLVPSLYDNGGAIMPGLSLVANKTGKPEHVLTNDQWTDIRENNGGNTIVINGVKADNATEVADELLFALKRTGKGKYNRNR